MPWVRLDDSFYDHPKFDNLSHAAFRLWACSIGYSGRHLTNGFISESKASRLVSHKRPERLIEELLSARLWERAEGGYIVHDYLEYNPTKEQVALDRADSAKRQAEYRERRKRVSNAVSNAVTNTVSNAVSSAVENSAPSHPIPGSSVSKDTGASPAPKEKRHAGLAPVLNAFDEARIPRPILDDVEAKAANTLIKNGVAPSQLAECWQDIAAGLWGDGWLRSNLSFAALVSHQRIKHYLAWVDAGRPTQEQRHGRPEPAPRKVRTL